MRVWAHDTGQCCGVWADRDATFVASHMLAAVAGVFGCWVFRPQLVSVECGNALCSDEHTLQRHVTGQFLASPERQSIVESAVDGLRCGPAW